MTQVISDKKTGQIKYAVDDAIPVIRSKNTIRLVGHAHGGRDTIICDMNEETSEHLKGADKANIPVDIFKPEIDPETKKVLSPPKAYKINKDTKEITELKEVSQDATI